MANPLKRPLLEQVPNAVIRESLQYLYDFLADCPLLQGSFEFKTIGVKKAETELTIPHNLNFVPLDIIQTSLIGPGDVTFHYEKFTDKVLVISTTDSCVVRFFAGRNQGS